MYHIVESIDCGQEIPEMYLIYEDWISKELTDVSIPIICTVLFLK